MILGLQESFRVYLVHTRLLLLLYGTGLQKYFILLIFYSILKVLLGCDRYSAAIDIWSAGCIFAELVAKAPLFPGKNEIEELD